MSSNVVFRNGIPGALGVLSITSGGTGQSSYIDGQILVGNTTSGALDKATITGTVNQIVVTGGSGSITVSLPQSIGTGSTPTFSALTLSNPLTVANGGLGASTLTLNSILLGNGTGNVKFATTTGTGNVVRDTRPTALIVSDAGGFTVQNAADNTKQARFSAASVSTGTIRTFAVPDFSGTLWSTGVTNLNSSQPAFLAYLSANQNSVTGAGNTFLVPFDTASQNIGGLYSTSTKAFTAPVQGWYRIGGAITLANTAGVTRFDVIANASSAGPTTLARFGAGLAETNSSPPTVTVSLSATMFLAAQETANIQVIGYAHASGNVANVVGGSANTWWSATLLF